MKIEQPNADLTNRFTYHRPFGDQPERYAQIRDSIGGVAQFIDQFCPDSREKSLAITKLEEAVFWANASIARNEREGVIWGIPAGAEEEEDS